MTDTITPQATPDPTPEPGRPRRSVAAIALGVVAAVAVIALGIVAVVAVTDDTGNAQTHMMSGTNAMNGSAMGSGSMNGSLMGHQSSSPTVPDAREIAVTATSFKLRPKEIHVRAGEDVTFVLTATDVTHDFTIDELGLHVAAEPGQPGRGGLHAPSTPGRYTAYCSVAGHRQGGMTATVVVDES